MLQSFLVYGFMIISFVWLGNIASKREQLYPIKLRFSHWEIVLTLIIFSFFSGVRYKVGVDYPAYLDIFKEIALGHNVNFNKEEWLFFLITKFLASNNIHYAWYFGLLAFVQLFFVLFSFKNERYLYPFLLFVLMTNGTYFMWMNGIRQCIVISIFIYSIQYIKERKFLKYLFWVLIGFFIHKSALLLIPLYFILYLDKDLFKSVLVQFILLSVALVLSYINTWEYMMSYLGKGIELLNYTEYQDIQRHLALRDHTYNRSVRFYIPLLINIIIVWFSPKLKQYFSGTRIIIYYNLFFIGALCSLLFFNNSLMQRPAMYFIYMQFIISACFLSYLWQNMKYKKIYTLLFIVLILMHLLILFAYVKSDFYSYYHFFWE